MYRSMLSVMVLTFLAIFGTSLSSAVHKVDQVDDAGGSAVQVSPKNFKGGETKMTSIPLGIARDSMVRTGNSAGQKPKMVRVETPKTSGVLKEVSTQKMESMKELDQSEKNSDIARISGSDSLESNISSRLKLSTTSRATAYRLNCHSDNGRLSFCAFPKRIISVTLESTNSWHACRSGLDTAYLFQYLIVANSCKGQFYVVTV